MENEIYLYRNSLENARKNNEISLWQASHQANVACKEAIEAAIRQNFDGMFLSASCARGVLDRFGFKRVEWVLANTIQQMPSDGRFRHGNREWAEKTYIPRDGNHNMEFVVTSHPEVLNGFVWLNWRPTKGMCGPSSTPCAVKMLPVWNMTMQTHGAPCS